MEIVELAATASPKTPVTEQVAPQMAAAQAVASGKQAETAPAAKAAGGGDDPAPLTKGQAEKIVKSIQDNADAKGLNLSFKLVGKSDAIQVSVEDASGKLIRKIPSDEIIKLDQSLKNQASGLKENYV
ncbi:MAG: flagellar protein FlaG [Desulfovibrionaceae bacterium]|nr:flagellar protein FlaG [Desulfovibrionaceae bacterium]MBF0514508.1 flagellar protein FlaG [Desulfovibrionaceae bacterium]